ncbi:glycine receptor subunit beta-type 4-like [Haemaphysalis longicornis]
MAPPDNHVHWLEPLENRYAAPKSGVAMDDFPKLPFLDEILENYDRRAWPTFGTPLPTEVKVYLDIYNMGPLNSASMDYDLDVYLQQSWFDPRLSLRGFGIDETVMLSGEAITALIWKPDLYFVNAKRATVHDVTAPNELVQITPDGYVVYGTRVRLKLSCHMYFHLFPLDRQKCFVVIRPYAQRNDQTRISWGRDKPVSLEFDIQMEEFDLVGYYTGEFVERRQIGSFSSINATFLLHRRIEFHLIQTYFPTCLAVFISWVAFYITMELPQIRVALGCITLLTVLSIASSIRAVTPRVTYVKAVDVWATACIIFIFAELAETTLVNYLIRMRLRPHVMRRVDFGITNLLHYARHGYPTDDFLLRLDSSSKLELHRNRKRAEAIDRASRYMFPACFAFFNLLYWLFYTDRRYEFFYISP